MLRLRESSAFPHAAAGLARLGFALPVEGVGIAVGSAGAIEDSRLSDINAVAADAAVYAGPVLLLAFHGAPNSNPGRKGAERLSRARLNPLQPDLLATDAERRGIGQASDHAVDHRPRRWSTSPSS